MNKLEAAVRDVEVFLGLDVEEVAQIVLFMVRDEGQAVGLQNGMITLDAYEGAVTGSAFGHAPKVYGGRRLNDVCLALREAWAWLEGQALLIPAAGMNGRNGFRQLSPRAFGLKTPELFKGQITARLLPRAMLHPLLREVWPLFMRGDYETAIFKAMKTVEVHLRNVAGLPAKDIGVTLARNAFNRITGPLTDPDAEEGEKEAVGALFAGALGIFKNPHSHRDVKVDDPAEAASTIMLASQLLRMIDARADLPPVIPQKR